MLALELVLQRRFGSNPMLALLLEVFWQALWVFPWVFGRGVFGIRNLAAGEACYVLRRFGWGLLYIVGLFATPAERADRSVTASRRKDRAANGMSRNGGHWVSASDPPTEAALLMDAHNYSGLARYNQLVEAFPSQDKEAGSASSAAVYPGELLLDESLDELCPCAECTASAAHWSRAFMIAYLAIHMGLTNFTFLVALLWTPAFTLGPYVWSTSWATALLILFIVFFVLNTEITTYFPGGMPNAAILTLEMRLRHRAVAICLRQLLERLTAAADSGDAASDDLLASTVDSEAYVALHGQLLADWRTSLEAYRPLRLLLIGAPFTHAIAAVISVAVGNCIPAYLVGDLAISLFSFFVLAACYATKNLQPTRASSQYRSASQSLSLLAARIPASRSMLRQAELAHRDLLASFADLGASQAAFFGVPVTFGTVRG
ncbi:hypothetical protein DFJ74DRAFT_679950, partial [Hyaloraphidium curvatum]